MRRISLLLLLAISTGPRFAPAAEKKLDFNRDIRPILADACYHCHGPDQAKRKAVLHQIQQLMHERVMFAPIWLYFWPSGLGPRVEEPALMLINPFPWAAPLEDVRLKQG